MKLLPSSLVIHRWCPRPDPKQMIPIGTSRDDSITHLARVETEAAFREMKDAAQKDHVDLHVIWAYRPVDLQRQQFREAQAKHGKRHGIKWLAPPGFSEHQTGWTLDIGDGKDAEADDNPLFERTAAWRWLKDHAGEFGFELSFPPGNWQGVSYEPWHWRYVGTPEAREAFHPSGLRAIGVWFISGLEALRWWLHP